MSSPVSPAKLEATKSSHRRRNAAKPKSKRTRKPTPQAGLIEVIDDWNHHDISGWLAPSKPPDDPTLLKSWEQQGRVDRLRDLIPFWRDGVMAAESGGEVAKLEDFLQCLEEEEQSGTWQTKNNGWGKDMGEDIWGPAKRGGGWDSPRQDNAWRSGGEEGWGGNDGHGGWGSPAGVNDWAAEAQDEAGWGDAVDHSPVTVPLPSEDTSPSAADVWSRQHGKKSTRTPGDSWSFVEEVARQEEASFERRRSMHEFYAMPTQEKVKKIQEVVEYLRIHASA